MTNETLSAQVEVLREELATLKIEKNEKKDWIEENKKVLMEHPAATGEQLNEACISIYPYASDEPGDLTFEAGEYITVTAKAGDWWTGTLNGRTGVFPFNYVEAAPAQVLSFGMKWDMSCNVLCINVVCSVWCLTNTVLVC